MEQTRRAWRPAAATAIGAITSVMLAACGGSSATSNSSLTLTQYNPVKGTQGGNLVFSDWEPVQDLNVLSSSAATTQQVATGPIWASLWVFDGQNKPIPAATLFALALGVAFGAVIGRSVPAMAATLVTFVMVRVGIGELARSHYIAPVMRSTHDLSALGSQADPTAWWLGFPNYYDSSGHLLGNLLGQGVGQQASYAVQYFQPGDRFWAFQTIESSILAGLALLILGFAVYWVTRRLT